MLKYKFTAPLWLDILSQALVKLSCGPFSNFNIENAEVPRLY